MNGVICAQTGPAFVWPTTSWPEDGRLECSFQGCITAPITDLLVRWLEDRSLQQPIRLRQKKRMVRVGTELLQNLFHHAPADSALATRFLVVSTPNRWVISTCNRVDSETRRSLEARVHRMQTMSPEERRQSQRLSLAEGTRSRHGGGGVGFQEILRKTEGHLDLEFLPFAPDTWLAIFTAQIDATHE